MIVDTLIVFILALVCYFIIPLCVLIFVKNERCVKIITWTLLGVYLVILIIGVWARVVITPKSVKITFDYSYGFFNKPINLTFSNLRLFDIMVNLVLLMPIGMSYAILKKEKVINLLIKSLVIGLVLGIVIEAGQFLLPVRRSIQLSDVLFNMVSMILGALIGKLYLIITKRD